MIFVCLTSLFWPVTTFADDALTGFNRAHALMQQGKYEQAVQSLQSAIDEYPNFAEAHHLLGLVYFNGLKQPEKAINALRQAVSHYPNFARAHVDLGAVLQHEQKIEEAEQSYQKALELYPRFSDAQLALAQLYEQTQQPQKAIHALTKTLDLNPHQPEVLYKLAYWHHQLGNKKQAQVSLGQLQKMKPDHLGGWLLKGEIAEREKQRDAAIEAYEQALTIDGNVLDPHYALGFLYQEQGNSQQAAQHFTKVIELAPQDPEAHLNLGVVLASLNQLDQAEQAYHTAISLDPNLIDAHYNLGIFYEFHRKDTKKALQYYKEFLKHGGTDERIAKLMKKVKP